MFLLVLLFDMCFSVAVAFSAFTSELVIYGAGGVVGFPFEFFGDLN